MNDRYLFRGKRVDNGEWIVGMLARYGEFCSNIVDDFELLVPVKTETVGQCTGLKDKNGKVIFEGDICKHRSNCSDKLVISVVTYTDGHFLALVNEHSGFELSEKLEIIGNCHDNPELLEVEI